MRRIACALWRAALLLTIYVGVSTPVDATIYHTSPAGDDTSGDGSELTPWRTITYAVSQAVPGDTIEVMDDDDEATDDYTENIAVSKSLTIERYDNVGANPQIKAGDGSKDILVITADSVTIKGLDIYGVGGFLKNGVLVERASGCKIQNNRFGWDNDHRNYSGITVAAPSSNSTISGNTFSHNEYGVRLYSTTSNNIVSGNTFQTNTYGVHLSFFPVDNTISDNTFSGNFHGIRAELWSERNTITGNTGTSNIYGISLESSSSDITITGNTFSGSFLHGIYLSSSSNNVIVGNTCNSNNSHGIRLESTSEGNTISGNTCSNNLNGIGLESSSSNRIYLNDLSNNTTSSVHSQGSTNIWHSPVKLSYRYDGSPQAYKSHMGNYYSDSGIDNDTNGIWDSAYDLPGTEPDDSRPLMQAMDSYDIVVWYLANPVMYLGDMSRPEARVSIDPGSSEIWTADQPAQTDVFFAAGNSSNSTSWTGLVTFTSAPAFGDNFIVEIGYATDQDGTGFWEDGPEATIAGDGSTTAFVCIADTASFTVAQDEYLAVRITNQGSSSYLVRAGGAWSHVSASVDDLEADVEIPLVPGYNAVSWNVAPENDSVAVIFGDLLATGKVSILLDYKNDGAGVESFDFYIPALGPSNPFQRTESGKGYFVQLNPGVEPETLRVRGPYLDPQMELPLVQGYNLVAYLPDGPDSLVHALDSMGFDKMSIALDYQNDGAGVESFDFYIPALGPSNPFQVMEPGKGYFIQLNPGETDMLIYPETQVPIAEVQP